MAVILFISFAVLFGTCTFQFLERGAPFYWMYKRWYSFNDEQAFVKQLKTTLKDASIWNLEKTRYNQRILNDRLSISYRGEVSIDGEELKLSNYIQDEIKSTYKKFLLDRDKKKAMDAIKSLNGTSNAG